MIRKDVVVDTNVPVVANGRDTDQADQVCRIACIRAILEIQESRRVVLDDQGDPPAGPEGYRTIWDEYRDNLNFPGEPGVGDRFLKYVYDNQYNESRVRRIPITVIDDDKRGFEELPTNNLDPSDRKFLAAAVVAQAPILNATESDWDEQQELLGQLSIEVKQLCPHVIARRRNRTGSR